MESQSEVRRIHVIYFLSRKGKIEHPHLLRVHHLSRNGVHLRDVKRWLGELRGKDMPESFAWSYKRRYKSGYVWQDLLDEDLITPISDNEYVLKGSEIPSTFEDSYTEKNSPSHDEKSTEEEPDDSPKSPLNKEEESQFHHQEVAKMQEQRKTHCEIEQEAHSFGSEISISSNNSMIKVEEEITKHSHSPSEEIKKEIREENEKHENSNSSSSSSPSKKKNKNTDNAGNELKNETPRSCSSTSRSTFSRSKSYTNGASHLFRNLMTCGTVDTRDSATVSINRRNKPSMNMNMNMSYDHHAFEHNSFDSSLELCKGDKLGGSQRVFGTPWNQQPQQARRSYDGVRSSSKIKSDSASPKPSGAYKPINGPQCSHCGKQFKPEKLHAHMKSCKGLKAFTKSNSSASVATTDKLDRSAELPVDNYSISGYYLTQRR